MLTSIPICDKVQVEDVPAISSGEISSVDSVPSLHSNSPSVMYLHEGIDMREKSLNESVNQDVAVINKSLKTHEFYESKSKCETEGSVNDPVA